MRGLVDGFIRFNRGLLGSPLPLQLWVAVLVGANAIVPLAFLDRIEAKVVIAVFLVGATLMAVLTGRFGFTRILGLGHVLWLPLLAYLWTRLGEGSTTAPFGLWLRAVMLVNAVSLVFDVVDVVRYLRGERDETVAGL